MNDARQVDAHGAVPGALRPDRHTAAEVVRLLELEPLPHEGGWFRRTATGPVGRDGHLGYSVIQALFTPEGFSALHRLREDELWFWQGGDALEHLQLAPGGEGGWCRLGPGSAAGEVLHAAVPAGVWQGARVVAGGRWSLVSCVVVPGFRWQDFELGEPPVLLARYPTWREAILSLTRSD